MRIGKFLISLYGFMLLLGLAVPSFLFAQSDQEKRSEASKVPSLLAEIGYEYVEVREGASWKIPTLPYEGQHLQTLEVYLESNPSNSSLKIIVRLGSLINPDTTGLEERLNDLTERFKPTEFLLSKVVVYAVTEIPAGELDKEIVAGGIAKLADDADRAYPEMTTYIRSDVEPSMGPGHGGGIGSRHGDGEEEPKLRLTDAPGNPPINVVSKVDSRPVMLSRIRPEYSEQARRNKTQGAVRIRVLVDETGKVRIVNVIKGLADGLTENAVEAVKKSQFRPAMKDGKPVAYWVVLEVAFYLR